MSKKGSGMDSEKKEELLGKLIDHQGNELKVREQEIGIQKDEVALKREEQAHQKELAEQSIKAQLEDAKLKQSYFLAANKRQALVIISVVVAVLAFLITSMMMNKENFAERIFDIVMGGAAGFAIAYIKLHKASGERE